MVHNYKFNPLYLVPFHNTFQELSGGGVYANELRPYFHLLLQSLRISVTQGQTLSRLSRAKNINNDEI